MIRKIIFCILSSIFIWAHALTTNAQLRKSETQASDYSGPIVKEKDPSNGANLGNLFNMQMGHSYSVNFASFGGQYQNTNAYTNTMQFFFSEKLTGRVDLSLLHSPFGNNLNGFNADQEVQFILRNAELNYEIGDNSTLRLQFNQYPQGYGYSPGYGRFSNAPFRTGSVFDRY